jgi:hypothetical protein
MEFPDDEGTLFVRRMLTKLQRLGTDPDEHNPQPRVAVGRKAIKNEALTARLRAYLAKYKIERNMKKIDFAVKAHIDERTLRRVLRSSTASEGTWTEIEKAISKPPLD